MINAPIDPEDHELTPAQAEAMQRFEHWWQHDRERQPIFRIFGYAGVGKTWLTNRILQRMSLRSVNCAYTGKAALVMQKHGIPASTFHSLIYKYVEPDKDLCNELFEAMKKSEGGERKRIKKQLDEARAPRFDLNSESALLAADICVIDECSMLNNDHKNDLLTFKKPVLVLGDPGQLPPIDGAGALTSGKPDVLLTEIHRQAADNPIIQASVRARTGVPIPFTDEDPRFRHIYSKDMTELDILAADQILTGKNVTRRRLNTNIRELYQRVGAFPVPQDKLICLRNNQKLGLYNGIMAETLEVHEELEHSIEMTIRTETTDPGEPPLRVNALKAYFEVYNHPTALDEVKWWERFDTQEFDFGYAITVHKSQGSQWDRVTIVDDKFMSWKRADRSRWLYTGITRAAENLTLVS